MPKQSKPHRLHVSKQSESHDLRGSELDIEQLAKNRCDFDNRELYAYIRYLFEKEERKQTKKRL